MKIDTHQHFWHYRAKEFAWIDDAMPPLQQDCLPADIKPALRAAGVDAVVAVQARTLTAETDFLLQLAEHNPELLGVIGWADLAAPELAQQLEKWSAQPAFKGLRHILQDESDVSAWVNHPGINHGLRAVQQRKLVYEVLVFDQQLPQVIDFCSRHDAHWLVLDHVGKPSVRDWSGEASRSLRWAQQLRELASMPHLVCKLSGLVTETNWHSQDGLTPQEIGIIFSCFDQALAAFGPQRLMFGSDWPVCQLSASYSVVHGLAQQWANTRLTATEQTAFWSGNAIRFYRLDLPASAH